MKIWKEHLFMSGIAGLVLWLLIGLFYLFLSVFNPDALDKSHNTGYTYIESQ